VHILSHRKEGGDDYITWDMEPVMISVDKQPKAKLLPEFEHFQGTSPKTHQRNTFGDGPVIFYYSDN